MPEANRAGIDDFRVHVTNMTQLQECQRLVLLLKQTQCLIAKKALLHELSKTLSRALVPYFIEFLVLKTRFGNAFSTEKCCETWAEFYSKLRWNPRNQRWTLEKSSAI